LAHLYRRRNPYPNPSLVVGGVCHYTTDTLLMYVSLGAYTTVFVYPNPNRKLTLTLTQR